MGSHYTRALALLFVAVCTAWGGTISFTGTFTQDDNVQLFLYSVQATGNVEVYTTSYDGTATGGFSPILSIFQQDGTYVNGDAGWSGNTNADVTWFSTAGQEYIVALTEWDNQPILSPTGTLADGFSEAGNGNFTSGLFGVGPGGFYTGPGGLQTTGNWAVTFSAPDPSAGLQATAVPEPAPMSLAAAGLGLLLGCRFLRKRSLKKGQEA